MDYFQIDKCKEMLKKSKQIIKESKENQEKIEFIIYLDKLEKQYQEYCNSFSPAYLSGSPWYVGKSLKEYILNDYESYNYLKIIGTISLIYSCKKK